MAQLRDTGPQAAYDALPDNATRRAYRMLTRCPGADFTATVAAATLDTGAAETDRLLAALLDSHLGWRAPSRLRRWPAGRNQASSS